MALLAGVVLVALLLAQRRGQLAATLHGVGWQGAGSVLLLAFGTVYSAFLIAQRARSYIDPIGPRYMLPGTITFLLLFAVFLIRATGVSLARVAIAGGVIGVGLVAYEVHTTVVTPVYSDQRLIGMSERLSWVQKNTTDDDLIIGQDAVIYPFYLDRTVAVSYSPFPFTEILPYAKTLQICRRFKSLYSRVLLVIPRHPTPQEPANVKWNIRLGPFIESINFGRFEDYPGITPLAVLKDGRVYQVSC
jgi:hypothetical protein